MRQLLAATAVLAALAAVTGCSGGKSGSTGRAQPTVQSSSTDCDFKGITAGARREGTCVARGVPVTVVNRAHWLHGKDYDGRVLGLDMVKTLGPTQAPGRFAIVQLRVKNTLDVPHEFDRRSDLAFLLVDGKYFGESPAAEKSAPGSFRNRRSVLQPDEAATGTVVFDLPHEHAGNLAKTGSNLILVNFADEAKGFPSGTQPLSSLGYIRLWK